MIQELWLIGIGTGSLGHVTGAGLEAMRAAGTILIPRKGSGKDDLAELRHEMLDRSGTEAVRVEFDYPVRDPDLPYQERVRAWHDEIAQRWQAAVGDGAGPVALLVWGDPSLYDSTLRIAERIAPCPSIEVFPGITAIQALTAAHAIPLNTVGGEVRITTGRRLRDYGWPEGAETVVVMLDGETQFAQLDPAGLHIWWGAYLGAPEQILHSGPLAEVSAQIVEARAAARAAHGWIMDTYLLRRHL